MRTAARSDYEEEENSAWDMNIFDTAAIVEPFTAVKHKQNCVGGSKTTDDSSSIIIPNGETSSIIDRVMLPGPSKITQDGAVIPSVTALVEVGGMTPLRATSTAIEEELLTPQQRFNLEDDNDKSPDMFEDIVNKPGNKNLAKGRGVKGKQVLT